MKILVEYRDYRNDKGEFVSSISFVDPFTNNIEIFGDEQQLIQHLKQLQFEKGAKQ